MVEAGDAAAVWKIFHAVVAGRDTYAFPPDTGRDVGVGYFIAPGLTAFVAEIDEAVVGMYKLIPNRIGLGAHVANASYMVDPAAAGRGVGRAMGEHSLRIARGLGYDAMQFNFVVSTNRRAVALWQSLGFRIAGTLPRAFRHGTLGLVDAYVMHRFLDDVVLTFGAAAEGAVVKPSVYAVIVSEAGHLAVVDAEEGVMLPGGGVDADESMEAAVAREAAEECALRIHIGGMLGEAVQFVHSRRRGTVFEKRSSFVAAGIAGPAEGTAEHPTRWLPPAEAESAMSYESHAWAIRRWLRLNS
jgi:GNAT superfamily N-acetyltransferase/ADP-ribose pyrophosphatase YjhB (NUDIX family)